jgi:hypothetical protein
MGSSGGVPSLGGGFFPSGPQFNPGALPVLDLMGWANSGGTQANPLQMPGGGIFGAPMGGGGGGGRQGGGGRGRGRDQGAYNPGSWMSPFSANSNSGGGYQWRR